MLRQWVIAVVLAGVVGVSAPAAAQETTPPQDKPKEAIEATDPISGSWDGTVVMPEGPTSFFMMLKLDKDQISGEIGNDQGSTPVTGTWVDGKMILSFSYVNGEPASLTGAFKDGQLAGEVSLGPAAAVTSWTAKKKA
jgi:hypothetical protein